MPSPKNKAREADQAPTPAARAAQAPVGDPGAAQAPFTPDPDPVGTAKAEWDRQTARPDPGPPPRLPMPDARGNPAVEMLLAAARNRDLPTARSVDAMRHPPAVGQYRAEVLEYLLALDTYEASR